MEKKFNYDENGVLTFGGISTLKLAKKFGTPLYLIDINEVENRCKMMTESMSEVYPDSIVSYASKAFCCKGIYKVVEKFGMHCDVVSGGEIATAVSAKFPTNKIHFHGNNKTPDEIKFALKNKIYNFVIDSTTDIDELDENIKKNRSLKGKINVLVRVNPGIHAHTHEFVQTSNTDSKFGINIDGGDAERFIAKLATNPNVNFKGLHFHIGSQIFDKEPYKLATKKVLDLIVTLKSKYNIDTHVLNAGSGFAAWYTTKDPLFKQSDYKKFLEAIAKEVKATVSKYNIVAPTLQIEPGRSIMAESGMTLYTVGNIKDIKGLRKYVAVDGGMFESPRFALYGSEYTALKCKKEGNKLEKVTIAGKCCESGDMVAKDVKLEKVNKGDIIAVVSTGAYHYSMASNYNRNCIPPVIALKDGKAKVMIKGQTYKDLIQYDC